MALFETVKFVLNKLIANVPKEYARNRLTFSQPSPRTLKIEERKLVNYQISLKMARGVVSEYRNALQHNISLLEDVNNMEIYILETYLEMIKMLSQDDLSREFISDMLCIIDNLESISNLFKRYQ